MSAELIGRATIVNGINLVQMKGIALPDIVKNIAFAVRAKSSEATAFVGATIDPSGKPLLTVMLTDDVVKSGLNASMIVREAAKAIKGGGGGQPGFAQAGGKDKDGIQQAFDILCDKISK
jgi:alanyl-tRNA synthetase